MVANCEDTAREKFNNKYDDNNANKFKDSEYLYYINSGEYHKNL